MPAASTGKVASELEVVKTQVKELKDKSKETTAKLPKLETRLDAFEKEHQKNETILAKLLENTQVMLVQQEKQSGALDLIRRDLEHQMSDLNFVRKKLSDKADKELIYDIRKNLEQENIDLKQEISDLKDILKCKANKGDIKRIWAFLAIIPPSTLALVEIVRLLLKH